MAKETVSESEKKVVSKAAIVKSNRLPVTELLGENQGPNAPYGDDLSLPLPVDRLRYEHPELAVPHDA